MLPFNGSVCRSEGLAGDSGLKGSHVERDWMGKKKGNSRDHLTLG